jgi:tRNA pseudouridine55 synthase
MPDPAGVLLVDKPVGPTSREVLDGLERRLRIGPLGHAGTLDPLASGLLVVLAGRARRLQEFFLGREKVYAARVRFGETSPTLDSEGPLVATGVAPSLIDAEGIRAMLARFEGEFLQAPPVFSAVRVSGRRAHKLARTGREVVLEPRKVTINGIELIAAENHDWLLEITCGSGVYVRSLARDLGDARGCGAHLAELRRTRSGGLRVEHARPPRSTDVQELKPLSEVLAGEPRLDATEDEAARLLHGDIVGCQGRDPLPTFGWFRGRPCFKLMTPAPQVVRSELLLDEPFIGEHAGGVPESA